MEITCAECHIQKPESEFVWRRSGGYTRKPNSSKPTCIACRERRKALIAAGMRTCFECKETKPRSEFTQTAGVRYSGGRCRACNRKKSAYYRELAKNATHLTCTRCKTSKPREEFSFPKNGKRCERRCKQCQAERAEEGRNTEYGKFLAAQAVARRKKTAWVITREEYAALRSQPCFYCGFSLPKSGLALDRKDWRGDYTLENVVPCCTECNLVKCNMFTFDEMILIGRTIASIKANRVASGQTESRAWGVGNRGRKRKYPASV